MEPQIPSTSQSTNCEDNSTDSHNEESQNPQPQKKKKPGIIYISTIPKYMTVAMMRQIFSSFADVGRVYLQLANQAKDTNGKPKKKRRPIKHFTEGWVEFNSKKDAKFVVATLNNQPICTRKKSKFYDVIWSMKYLPRFKWVHLNERLAYERAVYRQKMRNEISQAKREANFFSLNMNKSEKYKKKLQKESSNSNTVPTLRQRETDMEIRKKKGKEPKDDRTELLQTLFK